jgi:hypothetical protein
LLTLVRHGESLANVGVTDQFAASESLTLTSVAIADSDVRFTPMTSGRVDPIVDATSALAILRSVGAPHVIIPGAMEAAA